jgi:hypothetical protein
MGLRPVEIVLHAGKRAHSIPAGRPRRLGDPRACGIPSNHFDSCSYRSGGSPLLLYLLLATQEIDLFEKR